MIPSRACCVIASAFFVALPFSQTSAKFPAAIGCGNGVVDRGEECDPGFPGWYEPDLGGKTCQSEGYQFGELACTPPGPRGAGCDLDRSGCSCGPAGPPAALPKTGQSGCWDEFGGSVECDGTGQDGEYRNGVDVQDRFIDNLDGTVTDELTGLNWLKISNCFGSLDWKTALQDVASLRSGLCGLSDGSLAGDWRLPNLYELRSLIDLGRFDPAIPQDHPFLEVEVFLFPHWSSTTFEQRPDRKWSVNFNTGMTATFSSFEAFHVWPVRRSP